MSTTGESAQLRATVTPSLAQATEGEPADRLEWQGELDSAMADLDSRLSHPRRRGLDAAAPPPAPQPGQVEITSELLDEIARRVAQQVRRTSPPGADGTRAVPSSPSIAAPPVVSLDPEPLRRGIVLSIRVRRPLFRWRFWRRSRRRQSMISMYDHRIQ